MILQQNLLNFGAAHFPFYIPFSKVLQNIFYWLFWRRDPLFELQFQLSLRVSLRRFAIQPLQIAGVAASRFLGGAAACVVPSSFATGQS